ncbi:MAG: hypothetical protein IKY01_01865 [Prevotella sp.]|nr:hypothetical protein [Prevotella sp.]
MCTYNVKIDDQVLEQAKPLFEGDSAMQAWLEDTLHKALLDYMRQYGAIKHDADESVYKQVKALENDPLGLLKLGSVLKPSQYSAEELRDGYISEKYGV